MKIDRNFKENVKLGAEFFSRDARDVARDLLGKILVRRLSSGRVLKTRIVETEAYFDERDPASRAVQNGDLRKTMLMAPGTILVYGVHNNWLVNFVTGSVGKPEAVLLRALEPLNFSENTKGPGLLTKALSIGKDLHKEDAISSRELWIEETLKEQPLDIYESFRIGVSRDLPEKMRFYIKCNPWISRK